MAIAMPTIIPAKALGLDGAVAPSDRINIGIIGVNDMGRGNLANSAKHGDVAITGICDVSTERREASLALHPTTAKGYRDYRELLAQTGIDGVIISLALALSPHTAPVFIAGVLMYNGIAGLCYAAFSGLSLQLVGTRSPTAATQLALFAAATNAAISAPPWTGMPGKNDQSTP